MEENTAAPSKRFELSGVRYLFTFLSFLGFVILYVLRVNLNVAIVAMVNHTAVYKDLNESESDECSEDLPSLLRNQSTTEKDGEFIWSPEMQSIVLGAFYYGYVISQIPGGRLAEVLSGKWVFGLGTLIPALLTLLTPAAARYHVGVLIAIRALEGLAQGVTLPAMYSLLARWLPESEKGLLSTVVRVGISMGTVSGMTLSAYLCDKGPFGGWPSAFYILGILGCLWFVVWSLLVSDSPVNHPFISRKEVTLIVSDQKFRHDAKLPPIPWLKIFTSLPFLGLVISQIGDDWCFYTILTDLPTFFDTILHFKLQQNSFLSSFPQVLQTVVSIIVGIVSDMCIRRNLSSIGFSRKFCFTISLLGIAAGLLGVCLAGCDATLHVIFFAFTITIGGFGYCGYPLTLLDLSPEYAGTLMGIANTLSNLTGFLAPLVVGVLTNESQTLHQWRIVFYITLGIYLSTGLVYLLFFSAEKQSWSCPETSYYSLPTDESPEIEIQKKSLSRTRCTLQT